MKKSSAPPASSASENHRFGRPQVYALLLLGAFAAQCLWAAAARPLDAEERWYITAGARYLSEHRVPLDSAHSPLIYLYRHGVPTDNVHSPLIYLLASFEERFVPRGTYSLTWEEMLYQGGYLYRMRLLFVLFGLIRGASLWYVARRLYGNRGGYFALALYCFAPRMVQEGSHIWPDVVAGWGFFGAVFTAIAMSHTLYALPGTLPWHRRWRRTILMGIGLGLGVAAQFSAALAVPLALVFMLYLAPGRRAEAMGMLALACALAAGILFGVYGFSPAAFAGGLGQALVISPIVQPVAPRYHALGAVFRHQDPALLAMLAIALVTWALWKRARYFGNTAPLIVMLAVPAFAPVFPGDDPFRLWIPAVVFVFMLVAGVFADLLETSRRGLVLTAGLALLLANIGFSLGRTVAGLRP